MDTMLIEVTNQKAMELLHDLEEKHWIKVLEENAIPVKKKLSEKYRGFLSKEKGQKLNEHIKQMRSEWGDI